MAAFGRSLAHDLRYALRTLRRHRAFSIAATLLLAAGIGGTTLVFSVVDAILLRELPVKAPGRLARIVELTHNRPPVSEYPYRVFDQFRHSSRSFADVFAQSEVDIAYADELSSRPVRAQIVTGNYYSTLGVEPARGRLLTDKDEWAAGDDLPVIFSYRFWQRQFHGDEKVLGRVVHLEDRPFTVVGVTRPGFNGISVDTGPDIQVPFIAGEFLTAWGAKKSDPRSCCLWEIAGRLRPGVTFAQAQTETTLAMQASWEAVFAEKSRYPRRTANGFAGNACKSSRSIAEFRGCAPNSQPAYSHCCPPPHFCLCSPAPMWRDYCWRAPPRKNSRMPYAWQWELRARASPSNGSWKARFWLLWEAWADS